MLGRLLLLFILVPILELGIFLALGDTLGTAWTLAIIIITGILGAALTKSQGGKALANFQEALAHGKMPHREMVDGLLILIAGAVLLTPGFLTDTVGFLLLLPPVRAALRTVLTSKLKDKIKVASSPLNPDFGNQPQEEARSVEGRVIDV